MEPQKKYTQTVKKAFHISMAALDNDTATDEYVQVMCGYDNRKYLLCTLHKDKVMQCALDLSFDVRFICLVILIVALQFLKL